MWEEEDTKKEDYLNKILHFLNFRPRRFVDIISRLIFVSFFIYFISKFPQMS